MFINFFRHNAPICLLLVYLLISKISFGQAPRVDNVRIKQENSELHIYYNLSNTITGDSVYCQIFGKESGILSAKHFSGDIGVDITSGEDKKIIWNIKADTTRLKEEIKVTIFVVRRDSKIAENTSKETTKNQPIFKEELPTTKEEVPIYKTVPTRQPRHKRPIASRLVRTTGILISLGGGYLGFQMYQQAQQLYSDYQKNNWNQKLSINSTTFLSQYSQGTIASANADLEKAQKQYTKAQIVLGGSGILFLTDLFWPRKRPKTDRRLQYQLYPSSQPQVALRWRF